MSNPFPGPFLKIAGMGLLSGARTLSGLAMVSDLVARPKSRFIFFRNPKYPGTIRVLKALAVAEMAGDKMPFAPDRTSPGPLLGRIVFGGLIGAMMYKEFGRKDPTGYWVGAVIGSLASVAGAYGAFGFRKWMERKRLVPDFLLGFLEDAAVVRLGGKILAR